MSKEEQRRVQVLERVAAGTVGASEAARVLGVSRRQVFRLLAAYRASGMEAVIHGNRGRAPVNKTPPETVARIRALAGKDCPLEGMNTCHMQEWLGQFHSIQIGRATLERLLVQEGLRKRSEHGTRQHRRRRARALAEGMMLQTDGSDHDWLQGRGPRMCLVGAIDDARGMLVYLRFRPTEDQAGYFMMLRTVVAEYGIPMSIYHDKHTILRSPKEPTLEDELAGREPMSQVQRCMHELGIEAIAAHSPQAKGRVERLWGTLQDRLTQELRLADICDIQAANAFLPEFVARYNARFAIEPAEKEPAWQALAEPLDEAYYFASREGRVVKNDHTIRWLGAVLQLQPGPATCLAGKSVNVHVTPEDQLYVYMGKLRIPYRVAAKPAAAAKAAPTRPATPAKSEQQQRQARRKKMAYLHASA